MKRFKREGNNFIVQRFDTNEMRLETIERKAFDKTEINNMLIMFLFNFNNRFIGFADDSYLNLSSIHLSIGSNSIKAMQACIKEL